MLVPLSKEQLKRVLKKEERKAYFVNNEIEVVTLVAEGMGAREDDFVIFFPDPSSITDMISVRYEHIRDIYVDTKSNTIHLVHEHDEIFPEDIFIDIMIIQSLDVAKELNIRMSDNGISVGKISDGKYMVGEENVNSGDMHSIGIEAMEVTINLESEDLEMAMDVMDYSISIDEDTGVRVTDGNNTTYEKEEALIMVAVAVHNMEADHFIKTGDRDEY